MKYHKKIQEKGITLIALVVTIIILLILIGVTLFQLSGEKGMFEIAKNARKQYEIEKYIEEIEIARGDIQVEKRRTETLDELVQKIKDDKIIEGGTISKVDEETAKAVTKEGYILTIKSGKVSTYEGNNNIKQTGLIGEIQGIKESGIQTVEVEGITTENLVRIYPIWSDVLETRAQEREEYAKISKVDSQNGSILITCDEDKPTIALKIRLEVL